VGQLRGWTRIAIVIIAIALVCARFLIRRTPAGSDNMLVATDRTPVQAIVVCADTGEVLWRVTGASVQGRNLEDVRYGRVPDGFVQEVPSQGSPRAFNPGEHLQVHVLSATRDMGDGGRATGAREFLTLVNFGGPRPASASGVECKPTAAR